MDDLADLKWTSKPSTSKNQPATNYNYNASAFAALKPTPPTSGRASPLPASSPQPPVKPATPANDSFSNLVSFTAGNSNKNLSLQEQQKRLADLKIQQEQSKVNPSKDQYVGVDETFWNNLGSGRSTPAVESQKNATKPVTKQNVGGDEDIFAAFSVPQQRAAQAIPRSATATQSIEQDVDDPFGLSEFTARASTKGVATTTTTLDDDDVLGLLSQPVSQRPKSPPRQATPPVVSPDAHPQDKAVAELVDMGFPAEKARRALETTESGTDVQSAVGWLLNQAHTEARERSQQRNGLQPGHDEARPRRSTSNRTDQRRPAERQESEATRPERRNQAQTSVDKDPAQLAAEISNNFLKTAGSFWKQSTKKVQQAVQDFGSDSDSSQPKWMKEPEKPAKNEQRSQQRNDEAGVARRRRRSSQSQNQPQSSSNVTDEAMMLESSRPTPPPRPTRVRQQPQLDSSATTSRDHSPAIPSRLRDTHSPQPAFLQQQQKQPGPAPTMGSKVALSRQAIEDQASQAYVSSARRRRPVAEAPAPAPAPVSHSDADLLEGGLKAQPLQRPTQTNRPRQPSPARPVKSIPINVRPPPPTRSIPTVSSISMKACHSHREKGNEHFKRGDYSAAHQSYSTSITHLPASHPLLIVLLTNRALTSLKIGEPKTAISDSDSAMTIIGAAKGESETIDFSNGDTPKPMREYYGKALMRKAEALEQMEKWAEAAAVWREAVEGGHGGATSMQGRERAEKAAKPATAPVSKPRPSPSSTSIPSRKPAASAKRADHTATSAAASAAAVNKLRAANAAAEKADDEKFALSDSVSARIQTWKGGKESNLRALLGSLDTVLWQGSGWKKISMADLVLPGKVKIQYMKGIAKVHPDKIPTDATTEQRMISSAVFSALNEAWDKFKNENGL